MDIVFMSIVCLEGILIQNSYYKIGYVLTVQMSHFLLLRDHSLSMF